MPLLNFLSAAFVVSTYLAITKADLHCAAGQEQWEKRESGFVYVCKNGQWSVTSCIVPWEGTVIPVGRNYTMTNGRMLYECGRLSATELQWRAIACSTNENQFVYPLETVTKNGFTFTCVRRSLTELQLEIVIDDLPKPVVSTQNADTGDMVMKSPIVKSMAAPMSNPSVSTAAKLQAQNSFVADTSNVGDVCFFNGQRYAINADMELSGAWYTCDKAKMQNGNALTNLVGCVSPAGSKYRLGEKFEEKFFAFRCDRMGKSALITGYACVERYPNGTKVEFSIGRRWLVGAASKNSRYIMQCNSDGVNNIRRQAALCFYNTTAGTGVLTGGCMMMVGDVLVQCMPTSKQWPNVRVRVKENPSLDDKRRIESEGQLQYCKSSPLPDDVVH